MKTLYKVLGLLAIILVAGFAGTIGKSIGRSTAERAIETQKNGNIEEILINTSNELNKQLPKTLDKETTLDSTLGGPGKRFMYFYTLTKYTSQDISEKRLHDLMSTNVVNGVCSNKKNELFLKKQVQFVYRYRGKDGKLMGDIVVNPADCGY